MSADCALSVGLRRPRRGSLPLSLVAHPRLEQDVDVSGVRRTAAASASVLCHEDNDVATGAGEVKAMRPDLEERERARQFYADKSCEMGRGALGLSDYF